MNRRGFFGRIGALIAGAFAVKVAPMWRKPYAVTVIGIDRSTYPFWQSQNRDAALDVMQEEFDRRMREMFTQMNHDILHGSAHKTPRGIVSWIEDAK